MQHSLRHLAFILLRGFWPACSILVKKAPVTSLQMSPGTSEIWLCSNNHSDRIRIATKESLCNILLEATFSEKLFPNCFAPETPSIPVPLYSAQYFSIPLSPQSLDAVRCRFAATRFQSAALAASQLCRWGVPGAAGTACAQCPQTQQRVGTGKFWNTFQQEHDCAVCLLW